MKSRTSVRKACSAAVNSRFMAVLPGRPEVRTAPAGRQAYDAASSLRKGRVFCSKRGIALSPVGTRTRRTGRPDLRPACRRLETAPRPGPLHPAGRAELRPTRGGRHLDLWPAGGREPYNFQQRGAWRPEEELNSAKKRG